MSKLIVPVSELILRLSELILRLADLILLGGFLRFGLVLT